MFKLLNPEKKIAMFCSPKSACSTITSWWFKTLGIYDDAKNYHSWIHNYRNKVYNLKLRKINHSKYYKIIAFRNPYTRAVSSYIHASKSKKLYKQLPKEQNMTFDEFLDWLEQKKGFFSHKNLYSNQHWAPQLHGYDIKGFDLQIRIENLEEGINFLNEKFNLKTPFEQYHSKHYTKRITTEEKVHAVPFLKLQEKFNNKLPEASNFYTNETYNKVKEIYNEDIDVLGYDIIY